jgi:uncharacterized protein CbrC (UPF0167 family)
MTCDGCNKRATHLVEGQPHCEQHMLEALCSVPVAVIDIEAFNYAQMKEAAKKNERQSEVA